MTIDRKPTRAAIEQNAATEFGQLVRSLRSNNSLTNRLIVIIPCPWTIASKRLLVEQWYPPMFKTMPTERHPHSAMHLSMKTRMVQTDERKQRLDLFQVEDFLDSAGLLSAFIPIS